MDANFSWIERLPELLRWGSGNEDLLRAICTSHIRWTYQNLADWCHFGDPSLYNDILALPRHCQQRLVLAPRLSYILSFLLRSRRSGTEELETLRDFVSIEHEIAGGSFYRKGRERWSALGDYYAPPGEAVNLCAPHDWSEGSSYLARKLGHIVLDTCSPIWNLPNLHSHRAIIPQDAAEMPCVESKLKDALTYIAAVNPNTFALVGASLQSIIPVKLPERPRFRAGCSWTPVIGAMSLTNAQSEYWSTPRFVDNIVHESIHSLIYKIELSTSLYTSSEASWQVNAISPWSGRKLQLHSFVHACFVWYGLWQFWRQATAQNFVESDEFLNEARSGFLTGPLFEGENAGTQAHVHPSVLSAMEKVTSDVCSTAS